MIKKLPSTVSAMAVAAGLCSVIPGVAFAGSVSSANTTLFGPNVYVFDTSMPAGDVQTTANNIFSKMEANQFGTDRYALLFKPGTYNVNFSVGFYTQVAGLGQNPDDVLINGGANVTANWMADANATCNFWRTYENFSINPSATNGTTTIAVSQAAPIRRMHIKGGLWLFQVAANGAGGWASGGFLADSIVDGQVLPGSQQQWLSRNSKWGSWANGVWNMVFVGDVNAPAPSFPDPPYTVVNQTPVIREKPYLYSTGSSYAVFVPALQNNTSGPSWAAGSTPGTSIDISQFYIAQPSTASAASINSALASGKHILFTPGIYNLNDTLKVTKANTIILGLGDPSLIPTSGLPAISVADVDGVKVAGLILDAGTTSSSSLLEVGPTGSSASHSANPTFLYDLTVRTGGASAGKNDVGIKINSNDVVGDQLWLWRADHGAGAGWNTNPTKNGLVVNGNNVTIYGLFNEHHEQYQTLWNGNGGRVYFYQSEMPYDVATQSSWMSSSTTNGYASYKVASNVTSHEAWGVGVYSYFRDAAVKANSAIEAPAVSGVKFHNSTTIWLNGQAGSEITHVINNTGGAVNASSPASAMRQTVAEFSGTGTGTGGGTGTGAALSRSGWVASSNPSSGDVPANLLDNSLTTRWSTGTPMVNGQYFTVDMQAARTFNKVVMDSTNAAGDYARGYAVYVSNDGTNFGSAVASGTGASAVITATFATQTARYLRVVQTGSSSSWWSINEFNVYY